METINRKAEEGGYIIDFTTYESATMCFIQSPFWKALGKACGWEEWSGASCMNGEEELELWKFYALQFHEINLTEGWDKAVSWLESIINASDNEKK